jgi:hypothetical protein
MRLQPPLLSERERERYRVFAQRLLAVGESTSPNDTIDWPVDYVIKGNTLQSLADHVYDNLDMCIHPESYFNERAILAVRNDVVNNLNA